MTDCKRLEIKSTTVTGSTEIVAVVVNPKDEDETPICFTMPHLVAVRLLNGIGKVVFPGIQDD